MLTLPSAKVQQIGRLLAELQRQNQLDDLVLILSQSGAGRYLLVYNSANAPSPSLPGCAVKQLSDLRGEDHLAYDGPAAGLPAIDVLFPEFPTHGASFCALEHLLLDGAGVLRRTSYRLAETILARVDQLGDKSSGAAVRSGPRVDVKIAQLALPALLAQHATLPVAICLPGDLHDLFEQGLASCASWSDLSGEGDWERVAEAVARSSPWLVALEEVPVLLPQLAQGRLIELRPVLLRGVGSDRRRSLLRDLARYTWRRAANTSDESLRRMAYSLAVEAGIQPDSAGDLIALRPQDDLEQFLATGEAERIYRTSRPDLPGQSYSLPDWLASTHRSAAGCPAPWFTFPPLRGPLGRATGRGASDLGPVLWKAGCGTLLARTFWLLSRDLLQEGGRWQVGATPAQIADLAMRAALLYSLDDPWQWRQGRYPHFLDQCYTHLLNCLANQERAADDVHAGEYFRALRSWHACYDAEDITFNLGAMAQALHAFLDAGAASQAVTAETSPATARRLLELSEALTRPEFEVSRRSLPRSQLGALPFELAQYLRSFVDSEVPLQIPSPPFDHQLQEYWALHAEWRRIQAGLAVDRPSADRLDDLLRRYGRLQRAAHVPAHEKSLLLRGYEYDMAAIKRLEQGMMMRPAIRLALRTPWVIRGARERLRLEVENQGAASAGEFELTLLPSAEVSVGPEKGRLALSEFSAGATRQMQFEVRVQEPRLDLNVAFRYRDHEGQLHSEAQTIPVEVRAASDRQWSYIALPYEAGIAVFGAQRFFGRQRELIEIFTRLMGGITQPIMLRGPRRLGKTSLLRQIGWLLDHPDDLAGLGLSPAQISRLLPIRPVLVTLQSLSESANRAAGQFFAGALGEITKAIGGQQAGGPVSLGNYPVRAFAQHLGALLDGHPGSRLLVIVDEWDEVRREEFRVLERNLRSIMLEEQRVNWIVSSTWALSQEVRRYGSPFYNMCHAIEVREVDWESAVRIITEPAQRVGLDWYGEAVVAALELTGRRPYLIQLLGSAIVDYLNNERRSGTVTPEVVAIVAGRFLHGASTSVSQYFNFIWPDDSQLAGSEDVVRWLGRLILWALDCHDPAPLLRVEIREFIRAGFRRQGLPLLEGDAFDDEFDDQMTLLERIFDVIAPAGEGYRFGVSLVRDWFHNRLPAEGDLLRTAHAGLARELQRKE